MLKSWVEDEVTWNESAAGAAWEQVGAQGGSDRGSTVLGELIGTSSGLVTIDLNAAGLAVVQSWFDDPSSNNGLIVADYDDLTENAISIDSREDGDVPQRPMLTVSLLAGAALNLGRNRRRHAPQPRTRRLRL